MHKPLFIGVQMRSGDLPVSCDLYERFLRFCLIYNDFQTFRDVIGNPFITAQCANRGWNIPDHDDRLFIIHRKSCFTLSLIASTKGTQGFVSADHLTLLIFQFDSKCSSSGSYKRRVSTMSWHLFLTPSSLTGL